MFRRIRESRATRIFCFFMAINILAEIISPNVAMALTSGPSQPEVQTFQPVSTSEMVDLFSGDFKYNIPLMDVEGYPLNIFYNSNVGMDEEASCVGLGWNINVGAINRNMRGLPDDFNGEDVVEKEFNIKDNITYGGHVKLGFEIFGWGKGPSSGSGNLSIGLGIRHNNYTGIAVEQTAGFALNAGNSNKGAFNAGLGITSSADEGLNLTPSVSFSYKTDKKHMGESGPSVGGGISMGVNSRSGLKSLSFNTSVSSGDRSSYADKEGVIHDVSKSGGGLSSGYTVDFATPTYVPFTNHPMLNSALAINTKMGGAVFGLDMSIDVGGYYSLQRLATKNMYFPAYGYLNSHNGQSNEKAMLDFNREKDGAFSPGTEYLPVPNHTYDVLSVTGQGIGGTFRPFRNDVGHVFDPESESISDSYNLGLEVGLGNLVSSGTDIGVIDVHTNTGKWKKSNSAKDKLMFQNPANGHLEEPFYYKEVGEKTVEVDQNHFDKLGGYDPVRVKLTSPAMFAKASADFEKQDLSNGNISSFAMASSTFKAPRTKRNKVLSTVKIKDLEKFGFEKNLYTLSSIYLPPSGINKSHHIGEVTVLQTDGSRYIYGLPVYNNTQEEVSFNVNGNTIANNKDYATGLINYTAGTDDSKNNNKGVDNFYSKTVLPPYVHSYMLTAVVSPDYVDVTQNGPSEDDLGNYTRFSYVKVGGSQGAEYEWRTPVGSGKVNYNENTKAATPGDDYGNFVYGKKNVYNIAKIETKNFKAEFEYANRKDGYEVQKDGSLGLDALLYLKTIKLYSKKDLNNPIKTVHFVYDYSLCTKPGFSADIDDVPNNICNTTGIPNTHELSNDGGKLTLKQIYFTYGNSEKGKYNKYQFEYKTIYDSNKYFKYDPKSYDRWGNYKHNELAYSGNPAGAALATGGILPNWEFPYTEQDPAKQNEYAAAWALTKISLPSGADITVEYESDDYAYVQNLPAMDMFKITNVEQTSGGAVSGGGTGTKDNLMGNAPGTGGNLAGDNNLYLYFKLKDGIDGSLSTSDAYDYVKSHYIKDMVAGRFMYFRFLVNLTKQGTAGLQNLGDYFEYVSGYAEIDDWGAKKSGGGNYDYGYVKLKNVNIGKSVSSIDVNPISKAAWQMGRTQFSQLVWDANFTTGGGAVDVVKALVGSSFTKNLISAFTGPNLSIATKNYGKECILGKSWIRLYDPNGKKMGGGSRVKKITIDDNWYTLTGNHQSKSTYSQEYVYTKQENGETISSGVASYEPILGNDENPFRLPNYYKKQGNNPLANAFLIPDDRFYTEEPHGESFFPAASVGYSEVKVFNSKILKQIGDEGPPVQAVKAHATGHVIHKFYTAKDYPTLVNKTKLDKKIFKPAFGSIFKIAARDYLTASQGYVIELNDMHGKPKAVEVYKETNPNQPISKIEYYYKTEGTSGYQEPSYADKYNDARLKANRLSNTCKVINRNGSFDDKVIGVDYDFVSDFRESKTSTIMGGIQANVSFFLVAMYPVFSVTIWPDFSYEETRFRSAAVTKVISRYGILDRTVATDAGSTIETNNLAYDSETGDVLLTQTVNEFNDPIYNFTYPAHWAYRYKLMGQAYQNIGAHFEGINISSGTANLGGVFSESCFNVGDEIGIYNAGTAVTKVWVCSIPNSTSINLIDKDGNTPTASGTYDIVVLRSARKNQHMLPMGSVTSLVNPLTGTQITFDKVTKTSATEYKDQWTMMGGHLYNSNESCCEINGYGLAIFDLLKALKSNSVLFSTTETTLWSDPTYNYSAFTILNKYPGMSNYTAKWRLHPSTNLGSNIAIFEINWYNGSTLVSTCTFQATLPSGLTWNTVISTGYTFDSAEAISDLCSIVPGIKVVLSFGSNTVNVAFSSTNACYTFGNCPNNNPIYLSNCSPKEGDKINPFLRGIKGNWRAYKAWSYLAPRKQTISTTNSNTDIRKDGYFTDPSSPATAYYTPFWVDSAGYKIRSSTNWTFTNEITKYNSNGAELENKDALGRYSSAVYGYNQTVPILVASNAKLNEVAYDGFEDYAYRISTDCRKDHFNFYEFESKRNLDYSHTGMYSLKLNPGDIISNKRPIVNCTTTTYASTCNYLLGCNDFTGNFSPANTSGTNKKYVLSYWVKEVPDISINPQPLMLTYLNNDIDVSVKPSPGVLSKSGIKRSPIIDGWQRVEYVFEVPANTTSGDICVSLKNLCPNAGSNKRDVYFDDIRIHPFESNIKTFVYHPKSLRYMAELDANNFATFYEYDEEGSLVRTKKETERGIMTLKESRNHTKR